MCNDYMCNSKKSMFRNLKFQNVINFIYKYNLIIFIFFTYNHSGYMKLEHGSTVRMVVAHPAGTSTSLGKIRRVELSWTYDMDVLQPRSLCFFWCNDRLYVNSVTVDVMELPGRG